ncbi:MAG: T9SS type A sorting domain-containing protein [Bacteroidota bacterium]
MKNPNRLCICLIFILVSCPFVYSQGQVRKAGMNLDAINDWTPQLMFVDLMKTSRMWVTRDSANPNQWNSGQALYLRNEDGYPVKIPYVSTTVPQVVHTLLRKDETTYPAGLYTLCFKGTGKIQLKGDAIGIFNISDSLYQVSVNTATMTGIDLTILESDSINPVRDIRFIMPGFDTTDIFHPKFIENLNGFELIRFMIPLRINQADNIVDWNNRTTVNHFTQTQYSGVSYEYICMLCNQLSTNLWINVPHKADDNYITQLAAFLLNNLDSNLNIYLEYSNEVWNSDFSQNQYCRDMGLSLGLSSNGPQAQRRFQAKRSVEVFKIFEQVFGGSSRFIKVIAGQRASILTGQELLAALFDYQNINPDSVQIDAYSVGGYVGGSLGNIFGPVSGSTTINEVLDSLENQIYNIFVPDITANQSLAASYNLPLFAYEGGQSLRATNPTYQQDTILTNILTNANRDTRMEDVYCQLFDAWFNIVGDSGIFNVFSYVNKYGPTGSWGILESVFQDTSTTPKYKAINRCILNQIITSDNNLDVIKSKKHLLIYPNPANDKVTISCSENSDIEIFNLQGQVIKVINKSDNNPSIDISKLFSGVYFIKISTKDEIIVKKLIKE